MPQLYLDGKHAESIFIICAIQIIMACLVSGVTSLSLFTWLIPQLGSRKRSIWGRKSKGCHAWGQYLSHSSNVVIILIYQATPKQSTFNYTLRWEDQGCWVHSRISHHKHGSHHHELVPQTPHPQQKAWIWKPRDLSPSQVILVFLLEENSLAWMGIGSVGVFCMNLFRHTVHMWEILCTERSLV